MPSLCETCKNMREVRTARSRFLLCELSVTSAHYPKYPPQPVVRCEALQEARDQRGRDERGAAHDLELGFGHGWKPSGQRPAVPVAPQMKLD